MYEKGRSCSLEPASGDHLLCSEAVYKSHKSFGSRLLRPGGQNISIRRQRLQAALRPIQKNRIQWLVQSNPGLLWLSVESTAIPYPLI